MSRGLAHEGKKKGGYTARRGRGMEKVHRKEESAAGCHSYQKAPD